MLVWGEIGTKMSDARNQMQQWVEWVTLMASKRLISSSYEIQVAD